MYDFQGLTILEGTLQDTSWANIPFVHYCNHEFDECQDCLRVSRDISSEHILYSCNYDLSTLKSKASFIRDEAKMVFIDGALSVEQQNFWLKNIEESSAKFFWRIPNITALIPTIRSRGQVVFVGNDLEQDFDGVSWALDFLDIALFGGLGLSLDFTVGSTTSCPKRYKGLVQVMSSFGAQLGRKDLDEKLARLKAFSDPRKLSKLGDYVSVNREWLERSPMAWVSLAVMLVELVK